MVSSKDVMYENLSFAHPFTNAGRAERRPVPVWTVLPPSTLEGCVTRFSADSVLAGKWDGLESDLMRFPLAGYG
jgi:hypothetical protein